MADLREWMHATFSTPKRTRDLLKPELDAGTISYHDYQLAQEGLPPQFKLVRWFAAGALVSAGMFAYGRFIRIPRIVLPQYYNTFAPLPAFTAGMMGLYLEFKTKRRLVTELDEPDALAKAILSIRDRTGGPPGQIRIGRRRKSEHDWDSQTHEGDAPQQQPDIKDEVQIENVVEDHNSRWSQIRSVNTSAYNRSTSWDLIRNQRAPRREQHKESQSGPVEESKNQPTEQDKFDAMLEAERRMTGGGK